MRRRSLQRTYVWLIALICIWSQRCIADVCFVQISDLHVRDKRGLEHLSRVVTWLNDPRTFGEEKPSFLVVTGDLSDRGKKEELELCKTALSRLTIPCYVIPGNHDVIFHGRPCAFDEVFPGRDRYAFDLDRCRFLFDPGSMNQTTSREHPQFDKWLSSQIQSAPPDTRIVVFTHYPYGRGTRYGAKGWVRRIVLRALRGGRVLAVLSGHSHSPASIMEGGILFKTVPSLSASRSNHRSSPQGAELYTIEDGHISSRFVPYHDPNDSPQP